MKQKITLLLAGILVSFITTQAQDWNQIFKANADDAQNNDRFGYSVSISGDYVIVGAYYEDPDIGGGDLTDAGSAYIFKRNADDSYSQIAKLNADDAQSEDYFGFSVCISGDYAIVGAYYEDPDIGGWENTAAGSAYIFKRNADDSYSQIAKLNADDAQGYDEFGYSVSISGDYAVVGAYRECPDIGGTLSAAGSAYIFKRNANDSYSQIAKLNADDAESYDWFGYSVSINGDYTVVGAYYEDADLGGGEIINAGSAYIFKRDAGDSYSQIAKLNAGDAQSIDIFGRSVSINNDYVIVGAYYEDPDIGGGELFNAGSAYIFKRNADDSYSQIAKLNADDAQSNDNFSESVSISGDYAIVGAHKKNPDLGGGEIADAGTAYIFKRNADDSYSQIAKLNADDAQSEDNFGVSVSIDGDYAVIGAYMEDPDIGGGELIDAGSVYIFVKSSSIIKQVDDLTDISIYPNPTKGKINFEFKDNNIQQIKISDITGKTIIEKTEIQQNETIDLSSFESGIYIISIQTDKEIFTTKMVKK